MKHSIEQLGKDGPLGFRALMLLGIGDGCVPLSENNIALVLGVPYEEANRILVRLGEFGLADLQSDN